MHGLTSYKLYDASPHIFFFQKIEKNIKNASVLL